MSNSFTAKANCKESSQKAAFSDPAFANNKTLPIHRWVPWIAGFSSDFVRAALGQYMDRRGGIVLDPFSGVGTSLVEAVLQGHNAIGFEINPYAALASRIKVNAYRLDVDDLTRHIKALQEFYQAAMADGYKPISQEPEGFRSRAPFYSPSVLHKVLIVKDFVATIQDDAIRDVFRLAFGSTMVRYSNYSYEPSLGRRVAAGKEEILDFAVGETIAAKLNEIRDDIIWFQQNLPDSEVSGRVINDTFFSYTKHLPAMSVDFVVTSPPYLNNYHYNRNTRPHLYWLEYAEKPKDLRELERANFGKYWQTVREEPCVNLNFDLPHLDLAERLQTLRSIGTERGIYGGNGWANYAASYFNDCFKLASGIKHALRPGGTALVVMGNSIIQGIMMPTDQYFAKIAEYMGLELVEIHIPRATRVGNSIIQSDVRVAKADVKHRLYEAIVELRRQH